MSTVVIELLTKFQNITTVIGVVSFVIAVLPLIAMLFLSHRKKLIESLPQEDRLNAINRDLERYGLDAANLTREQKKDLLYEEMKFRHKRFRTPFVTGSVLFVFSLGAILVPEIFSTEPAGPAVVRFSGDVVEGINREHVQVLLNVPGSAVQSGEIESVFFDEESFMFRVILTRADVEGWFVAEFYDRSRLLRVKLRVDKDGLVGEPEIEKVEEL